MSKLFASKLHSNIIHPIYELGDVFYKVLPRMSSSLSPPPLEPFSVHIWFGKAGLKELPELILGLYLEKPFFEIKMERTPKGKPYLPNSSIQFNLSHSGDFMAMALSLREIGIDIEIERDHRKLEAILKRFFPIEALQHFKTLSSPLQKKLFFRNLWTRHEAIVKAKGTTVFDSMETLNSYYSPTENTILRSENYYLKSIQVPEGYVGAIASPLQEIQITYFSSEMYFP